MPACPNCGNETAADAVFCDQCGTRLAKPEAAAAAAAPAPSAPLAPAGGSVICPACGAGNVPGEAFCDYCGTPLEAPAPTVAEAPVAATAAPEAVAPAPAEGSISGAEAGPICPTCGQTVVPGEAFCANCGTSLAQPPIPPAPEAEATPEPGAAGSIGGVETPLAPVAEPAAPASVAAAEVPSTAVAEPDLTPPTTCPACGTDIAPGDKFCSNCGAVLVPVPAPSPAVPAAAAPPPAAAGARLIVVASAAEIPLPASGEALIGREDPVSGIYPDVDLTPHGGEEGGVSRRHARLIVEGGNYFVEDLDSTNFTHINKQKLVPRSRQQIQDGDELRCGRVALILRTG